MCASHAKRGCTRIRAPSLNRIKSNRLKRSARVRGCTPPRIDRKKKKFDVLRTTPRDVVIVDASVRSSRVTDDDDDAHRRRRNVWRMQRNARLSPNDDCARCEKALKLHYCLPIVLLQRSQQQPNALFFAREHSNERTNARTASRRVDHLPGGTGGHNWYVLFTHIITCWTRKT